MNNLNKGKTIFIVFLGSLISTIATLYMGETRAPAIGAVLTLVIFVFMLWFFVTYDPNKESGRYD